jgi:hypothetical protein
MNNGRQTARTSRMLSPSFCEPRDVPSFPLSRTDPTVILAKQDQYCNDIYLLFIFLWNTLGQKPLRTTTVLWSLWQNDMILWDCLEERREDVEEANSWVRLQQHARVGFLLRKSVSLPPEEKRVRWIYLGIPPSSRFWAGEDLSSGEYYSVDWRNSAEELFSIDANMNVRKSRNSRD